jgi:peptide chain release factor subunit 1
MSISENERFHLKKFVKELDSFSARHTEFVTVYVPSGYDLNKIIQHLQQEQGTATNIKSAQTRKNVIDALELMLILKVKVKNPPAKISPV